MDKTWKNEVARTSVKLNHGLYYFDSEIEEMTGIENKEIMTFVLTEHIEDSSILYYKLKGYRYWQGMLPMTKKVVKTFDDPRTLLWARSIFSADRDYIKHNHISIWNMIKHQSDPGKMTEL